MAGSLLSQLFKERLRVFQKAAKRNLAMKLSDLYSKDSEFSLKTDIFDHKLISDHLRLALATGNLYSII